MTASKSLHWSRRTLLKNSATALSSACGPRIPLVGMVSEATRSEATREAFQQRGYYITFMRGTLFGLSAWKQMIDAVHEDGGNLVILWMAGAFASRRYPITWRYNAEHQNVKHNFAGELIDYAHSLHIRVLLGVTPFGYDGVNQYAIEHPHLKAIDRDGNYTAAFGLGAWGFNLNPFMEESQHFMLDYVREMLEFYPHADGLLLESSDYAVSYAQDSTKNYYDAEFRFVSRISRELWSRNPDSLIVVYPHYFTGKKVPGLDVEGSRQPFDPRWGLFFTPTSAPVDRALASQAKVSLYWESSPTHGNPKRIRTAAAAAYAAGLTGFVPSFEPWTYVLSGPDGGDSFLVGQRLSPFGFGWLDPGQAPSNELLMRVNRFAYREFSAHPAMSWEQYRSRLSHEFFREQASPLVDDLLFLVETFFLDRTWISVSPVASVRYVKGMIELGRVSPAKLRDYVDRVEKLAGLAVRLEGRLDATCVEMRRTARWIVEQWHSSGERQYVEAHLS